MVYTLTTGYINSRMESMDMRKEYIEELLFAHFAGELTEVQEKELLAWLEADEDNRKTYGRMADWWATAHVPLFASDMKMNFEEHFGSLMQPVIPPAKKRNIWNAWMKVAAVALLLLSVSITSFYYAEYRYADRESLICFETVTPYGSQSKVILPDGSVVWVNAGSSLRYSKDFNRKNREILLDGEAYFEVTRDTQKPFIVRSEALSVRVMGTSFNVKAYKEDHTIDVGLVSGKVNVCFQNDGQQTEEVELNPNRMLHFNKKNSQYTLNDINGEDAFGWTRGVLRFDGQPFPHIAKDLERKYNIHIHIESNKLKQEVFTGSFAGDYTLNDVLHEIDVEHKYKWIRTNNKLTIKDK